MKGQKLLYLLVTFSCFIIIHCDGEKKKAREEERRVQMENDYYNVNYENTIVAYEKFLKKYPKNIYADSINGRMNILRDSAEWHQVQVLNTVEGYNAYLAKYPGGRLTTQARGCINAVVLQPDELGKRYGQVDSLLKKLRTAKKIPAAIDVPPAANLQVILVPETKYLFYIQEVLYPDLMIGAANATLRVYVTYGYQRGEALYWEYDVLQTYSATAEIIGKYRVVLETDGMQYLKEKKDKYAGAGCTSIPNLIATAVPYFEYLDTLGMAIEAALEKILSFAVGIVQYDSVSINQRLYLLKHGLTSPNRTDREQALYGLKDIEDIRARAFFLEHAHDREPNMRLAAAEFFGAIKDTGAVSMLLFLLHDEKISIQCEAIEALGLIGDRTAVESIAVFVKAPDQAARRVAACALANLNDNRGFDILVSWMNDRSSENRHLAVQHLGQLKDKRAVEPLVNCLKKAVILTEFGRDLMLIQQLSGALAEIGETSAVEPLIKILKDNSELDDIVEALKKLTGKDFGTSYEEWSKWWQNK